MAKDLIIGAFSNYDYDAVKPWIESINQTDFSGDKVLITINVSEETNQKIREIKPWELHRGLGQGTDVFARGDMSGYLRQFQERARLDPHEGTVRHRADRQGVPK